MSFQYIQDYYGVPAQVGRRVEYQDGEKTVQGVITGCRNQYVVIHFDGDKKPRGCYHPKDGITYLGMGKVPKMTASQKRYARYQSIADCFDSFKTFLGYEKEEREAKRLGFSSPSEMNRYLTEIAL